MVAGNGGIKGRGAKAGLFRRLPRASPIATSSRHPRMATLKGKTLFITGASRGIGLAIGLRAARDGANVAVVAKTVDPHPKLPGTIHTAVSEIEKAGGRGLACAADIRFEDQVAAAVEKTVATFGGIDILVNNASAIQLTGTLETEIKRFDLMFGVNVRGTFRDVAVVHPPPGEKRPTRTFSTCRRRSTWRRNGSRATWPTRCRNSA